MPAELSQLNNSENPNEHRQAQLICLARGLIQQILPKTLRMEGQMDYGKSLRPNDDTASPRKNKNPSLAQYESPDIASTVTVQLLYQEGLDRDQMIQIVRSLLADHQTERDDGVENTHAMQLLAQWQSNVKQPLRLDCITIQNPDQMQQLVDNIGKHPEVVERFLKEKALQEVQLYPEKYSSNHADFLDGGKESIVFSATLGLAEQYLYENPKKADENQQEEVPAAHRNDLAFQAAVVQRSCAKRNSEVLWLDPCSPKILFERIFQQKPEAWAAAPRNHRRRRLDSPIFHKASRRSVPGIQYSQQSRLRRSHLH